MSLHNWVPLIKRRMKLCYRLCTLAQMWWSWYQHAVWTCQIPTRNWVVMVGAVPGNWQNNFIAVVIEFWGFTHPGVPFHVLIVSTAHPWSSSFPTLGLFMPVLMAIRFEVSMIEVEEVQEVVLNFLRCASLRFQINKFHLASAWWAPCKQVKSTNWIHLYKLKLWISHEQQCSPQSSNFNRWLCLFRDWVLGWNGGLVSELYGHHSIM